MTATPLPQVDALREVSPVRLPQVVELDRQGSVLVPTPLGPPEEVMGLNVLRGCVHRCPFCSVRVSGSYPNDGQVYRYARTPERLEQDLMEQRPRAVFLSPATDPFPPITEVQEE